MRRQERPDNSTDQFDSTKNVSTDMKLLGLATRTGTTEGVSAAQNLNQLGQILNKRNAKFKKQENFTQNSQAWLSSLGIPVQRLINEAKHEKMQRANLMLELTKVQQHSDTASQFVPLVTQKQFPFPNLTLENQEKFTQVQHQFIAHQLVHKSLIKAATRSFIRNTKRILVRKLNGEEQHVSIQNEVDGKKSQYFRAVQCAINTGNYGQMVEGFLKGSRSTKMERFWNILYRQLSCADEAEEDQRYLTRNNNSQNKSTILYRTMLMSLTMLEGEISKNISTSFQNLNQSHGHHGWGVAYTYYKAGRKHQFFKILSDRKMRKLLAYFMEYQRRVEQGRISSSQFWPDEQDQSNIEPDIYLEQLNYILRGLPRISHPDVSDPWQLDLAWVVLRTRGLYLGRTGENSPQQTLTESINNYKTDMENISRTYFSNFKAINETVLLNLFYTSSYDIIVQVMQNQHSNRLFKEKIFTVENYLYLLLALVYSPHPLMLFPPYQNFMRNVLPQVLAQRLTVYVNQMLRQITGGKYREEWSAPTYYTLLLPIPLWEKYLPQIVKDVKSSRWINWDLLEAKMNQYNAIDTYQRAVEATIFNIYRKGSTDIEIVQATKMFSDLLDSIDDEFQGLLSLYLRKTLNRFSEDTINSMQTPDDSNISYKQLESLIYSKGKTFEQLPQEYDVLLKFIDAYNDTRNYVYSKGPKRKRQVDPYTAVAPFSQIRNGIIPEKVQYLLHSIKKITEKFYFYDTNSQTQLVQQNEVQTNPASFMEIYFKFLQLVKRALKIYYHEHSQFKKINQSQIFIDQMIETVAKWEIEQGFHSISIR